MIPVFKIIENVTVAFHYDPNGSKELEQQPEMTLRSGFSALYEWESRLLVKAFSIGLTGSVTSSIQPVDEEKFLNKELFAFYHSREAKFAFGSTKYRMALLTNSSQLEKLPPSSIGYDIPMDQWLREFQSSKFCLVM